MTKRRKQPLGQTIGGVLFGFEQQVLRNVPPPHELVHHARPDASVPAGDGSIVTIELPADDPDPTPAELPHRPSMTQPRLATVNQDPLCPTTWRPCQTAAARWP